MAPTTLRRPEEIREDVSARLSWDGSIRESRISVDVADGKIILSGTVPAYPDRTRAEEDAYSIAGVSYVDNRLMVRCPEASKAPGDEELASRIRSALDWNPLIDAGRIDLSVEHGAVTLTGTVEFYWQRTAAQEAVGNIGGVLDVSSNIEVVPPEAVRDEEIAGQVRSSLERNDLIDMAMINVHVRNGVVTLSGTVHSHHAAQTAEGTSGLITGVREINNYLVVS